MTHSSQIIIIIKKKQLFFFFLECAKYHKKKKSYITMIIDADVIGTSVLIIDVYIIHHCAILCYRKISEKFQINIWITLHFFAAFA